MQKHYRFYYYCHRVLGMTIINLDSEGYVNGTIRKSKDQVRSAIRISMYQLLTIEVIRQVKFAFYPSFQPTLLLFSCQPFYSVPLKEY